MDSCGARKAVVVKSNEGSVYTGVVSFVIPSISMRLVTPSVYTAPIDIAAETDLF